MRTPAVECRDFSFSYNSRIILKKISFQLEKGEWLTILGPNGSGKSTLLKCLPRLVEGKSAGEILVHNRALGSYSQLELARLVAYVPQPGGRIPPFTVLDFVNFGRYPYSWRGRRSNPSEDEYVRKALALTDTERLASMRLDTLSGGQRQKVWLAAALAQDTGILLLDEPTSFLDPHNVYEMRNLLRMLNKEQGITIIMVTHDLNVPFEAGGKSLVIMDGRIAYFGPSEAMIPEATLDRTFSHKFSYLSHPVTGKPIVAI